MIRLQVVSNIILIRGNLRLMKWPKNQLYTVITLSALMISCSVQAQNIVPSTFKHIAVDGSFTDWSGVPIGYTATEGPTSAIQYKDIYIANDTNYLYLRSTLYSARPSAFNNSFDNI